MVSIDESLDEASINERALLCIKTIGLVRAYTRALKGLALLPDTSRQL